MSKYRARRRNRSWKDLSGQQRRTVVLAGTLQLTLLVAALRDIVRRPADQIRGPKPAWAAACFVNFVGPVAYFLFGRRR